MMEKQVVKAIAGTIRFQDEFCDEYVDGMIFDCPQRFCCTCEWYEKTISLIDEDEYGHVRSIRLPICQEENP